MQNSVFVVQLNSSQAAQLHRDLQAQGFLLTEPPNTQFQGRRGTLTCTLYTSGKCVVQGKEMHTWVTEYLEPGLLHDFPYTLPHSQTDMTPHIGSDEAGKGDFFGPLCVAAVFADEKQIETLIAKRIKDSKVLTDQVVGEYARWIAAHLTHEIVRIFPEKYNALYAKFGNLNHLLAWAHATAIKALVLRTGCKKVLIDKFAHESLMEHPLKELGLTLEQKVRAEQDPVVAAAAILARQAFLSGLKKLSDEYRCPLPKGSGAPVPPAKRAFIAQHGEALLDKVAKIHFKI